MQLAIENLSVIGKELVIRWNDGTETYILLELLRTEKAIAGLPLISFARSS
jgi:hypothetical protein